MILSTKPITSVYKTSRGFKTLWDDPFGTFQVGVDGGWWAVIGCLTLTFGSTREIQNYKIKVSEDKVLVSQKQKQQREGEGERYSCISLIWLHKN